MNQRSVSRCSLLTLALLLAGVGCVHFDSYAKFTGPRQIESPPLLPLEVTVHDVHDFEVVSVLLLVTKAVNAPPYSITLVATDMSCKYRQLVIEELQIRYADGDPAMLVSSPVIVLFETRERDSEAQYVAKGAITRAADFTLKVRGHYLLDDQTQWPFIYQGHYKLKKTRGVQNSLVVLNGV